MKKFYAAAALAAMMFSACSTVEPVIPEPDSAQLSFISAMTANVVTRANLDANFKFNLAADAENVYTELKGEAVTWNGAGYELTNAVTLFKGAPRNLTAWAPAEAAYKAEATPNVFTLTPGVVNGTTIYDFVYQVNKEMTTTTCKNVALAMEHAMAKLTFKIDFPSGYTGTQEITDLTVVGTPGASDFDITDGSWGTLTANAPIVVLDNTAKTIVANMPVAEALVIPKTAVGADLKVTCKVNGQEYQNVAVSGITDLVQSTNYTITLTVKGGEMSVSSVTVGEWLTGTGAGNLE